LRRGAGFVHMVKAIVGKHAGMHASVQAGSEHGTQQ